MEKKTNFTQKEIKPINGMGMLILITLGILAAIAMIVVGCINLGAVGIRSEEHTSELQSPS